MITPIKAIRAWCLECLCGSYLGIKFCDGILDCPLFLYRFGRRPTYEEVKEWEQVK